MRFTEDQQRVIDTRDRNILVAAAAGSGKTAVLVERILSRIMDPVDPVDIDRILVVTFTRAAAAEMKERIRDRLQAEEERRPEDERLWRQLNLIHASHIMTIDSFCKKMIRDNFDRIGLDPLFRVADETEAGLLKEDAADEILEEAYEEGRPEFFSFLEHCSAGKDDLDIRGAIMDLSDYAESRPDPGKWIRSLPEPYRRAGEVPAEKQAWAEYLLASAEWELAGILKEIASLKKLCAKEGGPHMYLQNLEEDEELLSGISFSGSYDGLWEALKHLAFGRLSSSKDPSVDPLLREKVKERRNRYKARVKKLQESVFLKSSAEITAGLTYAAPVMEELSRLTLLFMERFSEKKRSKNLLDFSDLEHFALEILKTPAGEEYRAFFREVMTDEYQDSNSLQEAILTSIAGENNYFCVGDVKQSIYRFRLADPGIFLSRYAFSLRDEKSVRILLSRNFRSRSSVIRTVNAVFRQIMEKAVGDVEYGPEEELIAGADYDEDLEENRSELILVEKDDRGEVEPLVLEARAAADRILSLKGRFPVGGRGGQEGRPASFGDMVILLRTLSGGTDETYRRVLEEAGIPVFMESRTGYFQTEEIRTILSFLMLVDNPIQDIPLMTVLKSVFGKFTDTELAEIRILSPEGSLFDALRAAGREPGPDTGTEAGTGTGAGTDADPGLSPGLREKCADFLSFLNRYREMVPYTPIHVLIRSLIQETGYDYYCLARGGSAKANLELLKERAASFEETGKRGLFRFLRYIERLKKYEMDFGEAGRESKADAVRIMSIHKSKGMEFPIVILGNLGKKFNLRDASSPLVMDPAFGAGISYTDPETRVRRSPVLRDVISRKLRRDAVGEEIRVLYVAMTRAKEKLILTASAEDPELFSQESGKTVSEAQSFLDLIHIALRSEETAASLTIRKETLEKAAGDAVSELLALEERRKSVRKLGEDPAYDREVFARLSQGAAYRYPHAASAAVPSKVSVSELKKRSMEEEETETLFFGLESGSEKEGESSGRVHLPGEGGAERGTAYHKAFERLPLGQLCTEEDAAAYLDTLVEEEQLTREMADRIRKADLVRFSGSGLALRMAEAEKRGQLFREQPFLIGRPASELDSSWPEDETVLIQGIIDAFFEEEGRLVVVDYKTDQVRDADTLIRRYRTQLEWYAKALTQATGLPAEEKILYSVTLRKEIPL